MDIYTRAWSDEEVKRMRSRVPASTQVARTFSTEHSRLRAMPHAFPSQLITLIGGHFRLKQMRNCHLSMYISAFVLGASDAWSGYVERLLAFPHLYVTCIAGTSFACLSGPYFRRPGYRQSSFHSVPGERARQMVSSCHWYSYGICRVLH